MTTASPFWALFKSNARAWITAKGFWLVLAATLLPVVFIGAWAFTHRADVGVAEFRVPDGPFMEGENVTLSATFVNNGNERAAFNATVAVFEGQFPTASERAELDLEPGQTQDVTLTWTARAGAYVMVASADVGQGLGTGDIGERDEENNQVLKVAEVRFPRPSDDAAPPRPTGLEGETDNATTSVDLVVDQLSWTPAEPRFGGNVTVTAVIRNAGSEAVENATGAVKIIRMVGTLPQTLREEPAVLSIAAGGTQTIQFTWPAQLGVFWAEASALPPEGARESTPEDNYVQDPLIVDPLVPEDIKDNIERPERATFKSYYQTIILGFYVPLVIPIVALFYAGGVILDERDNGALPYTLTRPIPRWLIPFAKFLAGLLVGGVAVVLALLVSYAAMFGLGQDAASLGYLAAPLTLSLLALAAYLAVFTALGTWSARPYIIGLFFILAWETVAARLQVVAQTPAGPVNQPLLPWVGNLTVVQHLANAVEGWDFDSRFGWLPDDAGAMRALTVVAVIALAGLMTASYWMRQRDFDVG